MAKIKILSVLQPWATLIVIGAKKIETRTFDVKYRGQVAIHASKRFLPDQMALCKQWPFNEYIKIEELKFGCVIGVADLWKTQRTEEIIKENSVSKGKLYASFSEEFRFGDFGKDRFGWNMRDAFELAKPIQIVGALGLRDFELTHPLVQEVSNA